VFVASNLSQIISRYESVFDVYLCAAMVFPLFLLLSWIRNYRWLSPTSIMGTSLGSNAISGVIYRLQTCDGRVI